MVQIGTKLSKGLPQLRSGTQLTNQKQSHGIGIIAPRIEIMMIEITRYASHSHTFDAPSQDPSGVARALRGKIWFPQLERRFDKRDVCTRAARIDRKLLSGSTRADTCLVWADVR